jgi:hypothetical protein
VSPAAFVVSTDAAVVVPDDLILTKKQIEPIMELGSTYVRAGRLNDALALYVSTLRSFRNAQKKVIVGRGGVVRHREKVLSDDRCYEAQIMQCIGEISWALGARTQGATWTEGAYNAAIPHSRAVVECGLCVKNTASILATMYKALSRPAESDKFANASAMQKIPHSNPRREPYDD